VNWHRKRKDEPKVAWSPDLPIIPDVEQRWFTQAVLVRIIAAATGQYKVLFHLAGYSGLRSGEMAALRIEDIDFARGFIRVRRSMWRGQEVSTKTKRGY
jgi:integrase